MFLCFFCLGLVLFCCWIVFGVIVLVLRCFLVLFLFVLVCFALFVLECICYVVFFLLCLFGLRLF